MSYNKLLTIAASSAIIVWVAMAAYLGFELLVIGLIAIPIMTVIAFGALVSFEKLFKVWPSFRKLSWFLGLASGALIGLIFYLLLFMGSTYAVWLAAQYTALGAAVGLCAATLYLLGAKNA